MSEIVKRRIEAALRNGPASLLYQRDQGPEMVPDMLAASDGVLREAGERIWWCGVHLRGLKTMKIEGCRDHRVPTGCGWRLLIDPSSLLDEGDV